MMGKTTVDAEKLLKKIFGDNHPKTPTEKYDAIMSDARKIYERNKSYSNPYAFHLAFEFAKERVDKL